MSHSLRAALAWVALAATLFVLACVGIPLVGRYRVRGAELAAAQQATKAALEMSDRAWVQGTADAAAARSAQVRAVQAERRAVRAESSLSVARLHYREVVASMPDTCRPVVVAADSALSLADSVAAELHLALEASEEAADTAIAGLERSTHTLDAIRDSLRAPMPTSRAPRSIRSLLSLRSFRPRPGLGVALGVTPTGRPAVIAGLTFGWSF